jgi:hypothetical protein
MSAKTDQLERSVASYINSIKGITASRPNVSTKYADVKVTKNGITTWIEVKENHSAQLGTPRFYYENEKWKSTQAGVSLIVNELNKQNSVKEFVEGISSFSGISKDKLKMFSTKGGVNQLNAVPFDIFIKYLETLQNQYIMRVPNFDLGKVIVDLYHNKKEPAYYMQSGDDFYMIGKNNPFKFSNDVPLIQGRGELIVRFSPRRSGKYYEFLTELKLPKTEWPSSDYSFLPGTKKTNPFFAL